jgi:hypothetical protein
MERINKILIGEAAILIASAGFGGAQAATMEEVSIPTAIVQQAKEYEDEVNTITVKLDEGKTEEVRVIFDSSEFKKNATAFNEKRAKNHEFLQINTTKRLSAFASFCLAGISGLSMLGTYEFKRDKKLREARMKKTT